MKEYVNGVKISEVKEIYGIGGSADRASFHIIYKDGSKETFTIITKDNTSYKLAKEIKTEIKQAYNEYNNIPEIYLLENEIYIYINGQHTHFGTRCIDILDDYVYLTNKEVKELKKQFKIKDEGWRHLSSCTLFRIEGNKINKKVPQRYIDQLEYMGYDTSILEYELC